MKFRELDFRGKKLFSSISSVLSYLSEFCVRIVYPWTQQPALLQITDQAGGGSVMMWGMFSKQILGPLMSVK